MSENESPEEWLTADEWRTLLRISKGTAYRALNRGEVPGATRVGAQWRIPRSALEPRRRHEEER
jgi:excisionase family DNA binding protein